MITRATNIPKKYEVVILAGGLQQATKFIPWQSGKQYGQPGKGENGHIRTSVDDLNVIGNVLFPKGLQLPDTPLLHILGHTRIKNPRYPTKHPFHQHTYGLRRFILRMKLLGQQLL